MLQINKPQPPYHIAFILSSFRRGGTETRLADVVNGLDKTRWNPHLYLFYGDRMMQDKVEMSRIHYPFSTGKFDLLTIFRLAKALRQNQAMFAWVTDQGTPAAWGRLAALIAGMPFRILSLHDNTPLAPLTRLFNPWTDAIAAVSQYTLDNARVRGVPDKKGFLIYNGLDIEQYKPGENRRTELFHISAERPVILNIGRLIPLKGRDVMIKAAKNVIEAYPENPPLIVFAGGGSQQDELENLAGSLGIGEHMHWLGVRPDVPDLLRSSDIVVMSSRTEACPNVVLEGMASGVPVVSTAVGGAPELLIDGETGFLIPPEDDNALAEKLILLLGDKQLRHRMGEAGRQRVIAKFSIEQMVQARVHVLETLLQRKGFPLP